MKDGRVALALLGLGIVAIAVGLVAFMAWLIGGDGYRQAWIDAPQWQRDAAILFAVLVSWVTRRDD